MLTMYTYVFCETFLFLLPGSHLPGCMDIMVDYSRDGLFTRAYYPTEKTTSIEVCNSQYMGESLLETLFVAYLPILKFCFVCIQL